MSEIENLRSFTKGNQKMKYSMLTSFAWLACLVTTCATVGCQNKNAVVNDVNTESDNAILTIVEGEQPTDEQQQSMLAAKETLFQKLSGRLMQAMGEQGPAAAIEVCQKEASKIATEVGDAAGLRIGRTGVRLRNQKNEPPEWAKPLTQQRIDTPTFVTLSNGDAAALLPIKLQGQCLMCHGPKEQIAPVISDQLAILYPQDQATGFQEGELRGWFWIQQPAIATKSLPSTNR
jgi:hypothetical protein